ncbi:MAG: hypothetical protein O7E52_23615 [Candidatus Poribacteria bacterium]|nr:hypothetical protein [Candidatus Poribacteria bacterium]
MTLRIYNLQGELIRTLERGRQAAGVYLSREEAAYWDGMDSAGQPVPSQPRILSAEDKFP